MMHEFVLLVLWIKLAEEARVRSRKSCVRRTKTDIDQLLLNDQF